MACVNCNKIRAAILHGKMAEAAGLTVDALREKLGLKADPVEVKQEFSIVGAISPETVAEIVETGKAASKGK
ncbi:Putative secreted protein [Sphingopyxis fribergensis]|uniref:Putative secreted protein n=2 Tax=Sphingopyxis fribergensis TaxID=1515612 RepID=A0A0A7PDZ7_9SPHN|nr:Putative secreted protein [Sphingopyxis fribergensis]